MNIKTIIKNLFQKKEILPYVNTPVLCGELLKDRTIAIAGGSGGIGVGIAKRCVANGAKVVLLGRNEDKLKAVCSELGKNAKFVIADFNDFASYEDIVVKCDSQFEQKIDSLVNASGLMGKMNFFEITEKMWDDVMNINLKSVYFLSQKFAAYFIKNEIKGHIVNISSTSALKPGWVPYGISKAGVASMTVGLADELIKYGIVVNSVAPGPVATAMLGVNEKENNIINKRYKAGRYATPEEIGNWVAVMLSDMGQLVLGDSLYVSGGSGTLDICKKH